MTVISFVDILLALAKRGDVCQWNCIFCIESDNLMDDLEKKDLVAFFKKSTDEDFAHEKWFSNPFK